MRYAFRVLIPLAAIVLTGNLLHSLLLQSRVLLLPSSFQQQDWEAILTVTNLVSNDNNNHLHYNHHQQQQFHNVNNHGTTRSKDDKQTSLSLSSSSLETLLLDSQPGKPFIIIHYGPAKTGSSTLQNELSVWKDDIYKADNVLYGGAYYVPGKFMGRLPVQHALMDLPLQCSRTMAKARTQWEQQQQQQQQQQSSPATKTKTFNNNTTRSITKNSLAEFLLERVPCAAQLVQELQPYHVNGTSLIFSNELKSTTTHWKTMPGYTHVVSQDWQSLQALLGRDWNFRLVLGHRPFLDWVPSAKHQVEKYKPSKPKLANWPMSGGTNLQTMFPPHTLVEPNKTWWDIDADESVLQQNRSENKELRYNKRQAGALQRHWNKIVYPFAHSSTIYDWTADFLPIRFLHLHDDTPVRTNFLCHILHGITPNSCRASRQADATEKSKFAHMNAGQKYADRTWYDQLAVQAVRQGLVDHKRVNRAAVTEACMEHHQTVLNQTLLDLPHRCPNPAALRTLWDCSWQKEVATLGIRNANWTRHVDIFRRNLAEGKYCSLDATQALQQAQWQTFFQQGDFQTARRKRRR